MRSHLFTYLFVVVLVISAIALLPWPIRRDTLAKQLKVGAGRLAVFLAMAGIMMEIVLNIIQRLNQGPVGEGETVKILAIFAEAWVLPIMAFVSMLLVAFNLLKGVLRHIGYWYPLVFFVCVMARLIPAFYSFYMHFRLFFVLITVLWAYGFWENSTLLGRRPNCNESEKSQPTAPTLSLQMFFIMVVWLAPVVVLPLYLLTYIGIGMSAGSPNTSFGDFTLLATAPVVALLVWLATFIRGKITTTLILVTMLPVLLSLAELTIAVRLWKAA